MKITQMWGGGWGINEENRKWAEKLSNYINGKSKGQLFCFMKKLHDTV